MVLRPRQLTAIRRATSSLNGGDAGSQLQSRGASGLDGRSTSIRKFVGTRGADTFFGGMNRAFRHSDECGYATSSYDCGPAAQGENARDPNAPFCISASPNSTFNRHGEVITAESLARVAFCAAEREPSPDCQADFQQDLRDAALTCSGHDQLKCWYGYILTRVSCADQLCPVNGSLLSCAP